MIHNVLNRCNWDENNYFILAWLIGRNRPKDVAGDLNDGGTVGRSSKQRVELSIVLEAGTILMRRRNCYGKQVNAMDEAKQKKRTFMFIYLN